MPRFTPEEALVIVEEYGGQSAAARALGVTQGSVRAWIYPEEVRAEKRRHYAKHGEKVRAERRRYYAKHIERQRAVGRARYYRLRDAGLCTCCGAEPILSEAYCWDCLNKREERRVISF